MPVRVPNRASPEGERVDEALPELESLGAGTLDGGKWWRCLELGWVTSRSNAHRHPRRVDGSANGTT